MTERTRDGWKGHGRSASALIVGLAVVVSGCATRDGPTDPAPDEDRRTRLEIADRPAVPGATSFLPDAALVSFEFRTPDGDTRRDTVIGASRVAGWLESLGTRTAQRTGQSFVMETREILLCEGAAVERGRFPIPVRATAGGEDESLQPYLALWRPTAGDWKVESLWLMPPSSLRHTDLAEGCRAPPLADRLPITGWVIGIDGGTGTAPDVAGYQGMLADDGFENVVTDESAGPWFGLSISRRIRAPISVLATIATRPSARVTGVSENLYSTWTRSYEVQPYMAALMAELRWRQLAVALGPALSRVAVERSNVVDNTVNQTSSVHTMELDQTGFMARISAGHRFWRGLQGTAAVTYAVFSDLEPGQVMIPPGINPGGAAFSIGVGWNTY